jgi:uncharacterized protein (AIM24 family)
VRNGLTKMSGLPQLLPTTAEAETFGGVAHGTGFFIDKFHSHAGDGILWLLGCGNVFEKVLGPGEVMDSAPGGWLYKAPTVRMETVVDQLTSGLFGGFNLSVNRLTGPGRVGIQSMYMHYASEE